MYFNDIQATNKAEQIRAWAVEKSLELADTETSRGDVIDNDTIIDRAVVLEKYVLNGKKEATDGSE